MGTLYEKIIMLCNKRGIKGGKMCLDIGMSKGILTDLKMGRQSGISTANAKKIADYFDVSVDFLLDGRVDPDCTPDDENPHEVELRDTFGSLDIDDQIYVKNWVNSYAQNPEQAKKAPTDTGKRSISDEEIKFALFGGDGEITDAMYEEVRRFAAFVKQREAEKK